MSPFSIDFYVTVASLKQRVFKLKNIFFYFFLALTAGKNNQQALLCFFFHVTQNVAYLFHKDSI